VSMNLVFVLFDHVQTLENWCSFLVSASHVFIMSGSLMSHILPTWRNACIRELMVSSAFPSLSCACRKSSMSCSVWAGVVIFWAGVVIPA